MVRYICVSEYRTEMPSRVYAHGNTQYTCELLIATYNTAAIIQHCSVFNAVTTWVIFVLYIYTGEGRGEGGGARGREGAQSASSWAHIKLVILFPAIVFYTQDSISLKCFVFFRESASGINRVSYFLAVNLAYIPILLASPAVYLSIYFSVASFLGKLETLQLLGQLIFYLSVKLN